LEQKSLRELGRGQTAVVKQEKAVQLLQSPVSVFNCSSRRPSRVYAYTGKSPLQNVTPPSDVAKSDYVINRLVSSAKSGVIIADIQRDAGTSKTVLAGEKSLAVGHYADGQCEGDRLSMFGGDSEDIARQVAGNVAQDDVASGSGFGAAHPGICQFVYCDGSVRAIAYGEFADSDAEVDQ
jgi:hypothetical protein